MLIRFSGFVLLRSESTKLERGLHLIFGHRLSHRTGGAICRIDEFVFLGTFMLLCGGKTLACVLGFAGLETAPVGLLVINGEPIGGEGRLTWGVAV